MLFDGIRTCLNACVFCFMAMLPKEARATLTLRDDDYRLSFLQGNFVTLTNVTDEDVERIVTCGLEPMNVSIHAISADVRRKMIGARAALGNTRFQLSDEFYVDADLPVPPAETYDGYPQFYDGIGMLRSFLDESALVRSERAGECEAVNAALAKEGLGALLVCGEAAEKTIAVFAGLLSPEGSFGLGLIDGRIPAPRG